MLAVAQLRADLVRPGRGGAHLDLLDPQEPLRVVDQCVQLHGGAGYMKEYGVERAWRDLRLNRIGAGTDEIMLDVIGRSYGL